MALTTFPTLQLDRLHSSVYCHRRTSLGELHHLAGNIDDAYGVRCQPNPEQLDLVLTYQRNQASSTDDGQDIGEIMGATGNHRHRGCRSRDGNNFSGRAVALYRAPKISIQTDLDT